MGVLSSACLGVPTYTKLEEKKNGLDVYRPLDGSYIDKTYDTITYICPICNQLVKEKEMTSSFEKMLDKGGKRIKVLIKRYVELLVDSEEEVDIFDSLEKIYFEIEDIKNNYDENKYFNHTCYLKNKKCYIILFKEPKSEIEKWSIPPMDAKFHYLSWKNDENLKKEILKIRQNTINYKKEQKQQKIIDDQIENKRQELIREWDKMTSAKEQKQILICYETFKFKANSMRGYFDMGESTNIANTFHECNGGLKYSGSKKKLAEMMSMHGKSEFHKRDAYRMILRLIWMSKEEEKQFNVFANPKIEAFKKTLGV